MHSKPVMIRHEKYEAGSFSFVVFLPWGQACVLTKLISLKR